MTSQHQPPPSDRARRFEAEALPHAAPLRAFAARLEREPDAALDLVQETWLRAFRSFDSYAPGTNARAWLFRILYRVFLNRERTRGREVTTAGDEERAAPPPGLSPAEWDAWSGGKPPPPAPSRAVLGALDAIPEPFRTPLLLVDANELSYEEAARVLGVPVGTVRSRLSRGRRLLLAALVVRGVGPEGGAR